MLIARGERADQRSSPRSKKKDNTHPYSHATFARLTVQGKMVRARSDRSIPSNICVGLEARVPSEELTVTSAAMHGNEEEGWWLVRTEREETHSRIVLAIKESAARLERGEIH